LRPFDETEVPLEVERRDRPVKFRQRFAAVKESQQRIGCFASISASQHRESQQLRRNSFDRQDDVDNESSTAHIERNDLTAQLLASQNVSDQRGRENNLQADEKTAHPSSVASHGYSTQREYCNT
jgi:hypothetical protein